jgi:anti-sigma regulatory factor (Ser/Thr protein kinase)
VGGRRTGLAGPHPGGVPRLRAKRGPLQRSSLRYTGKGCRLALWKRDGKLICEIRDGGRLDDPLAGRRAPSDHATTGRGLLLVNALADLVRMYTSDTGTTIQAYLPLTAESVT